MSLITSRPSSSPPFPFPPYRQGKAAGEHFCPCAVTTYDLNEGNLTFTPSFHVKKNYNFTFLRPFEERGKATATLPPLQAAQQQSAGLSALTVAGADVIADSSAVVRGGFTLFSKLLGTRDHTALSALGMTTGFGLVLGGLAIRSGRQEVEKARKIVDRPGLALAHLKIAQASATAAAGGVFIPVRVLTLAAIVKEVPSAVAIAGVLGSMGGALFVLVIFFAAVGRVLRLAELYRFNAELNGVLKDAAAVQQQPPATVALEHLKKFLSISAQTEAEIAKALEKNSYYLSLKAEQKAEFICSTHQLLLQKREAFLARVTSEECVRLIRQTDRNDCTKTLATVQSKCWEKRRLSLLVAGLLGTSLSLTMASVIFTGAAAVTAIAVAGFAISLSWFLFDLHGFIQECRSSPGKEHDAFWLRLSNSLAVGSVGTACLLSNAALPVVVAACAVGALWLAVNQLSAHYLKGSLNRA